MAQNILWKIKGCWRRGIEVHPPVGDHYLSIRCFRWSTQKANLQRSKSTEKGHPIKSPKTTQLWPLSNIFNGQQKNFDKIFRQYHKRSQKSKIGKRNLRLTSQKQHNGLPSGIAACRKQRRNRSSYSVQDRLQKQIPIILGCSCSVYIWAMFQLL
jgi:hypothetical protein